MTLFPTLPFIQGPPPEPFKIGLELFQLYPVWFFPEGRAIVEADLSFPEGGSIGYASGKPAGLAVGHRQKLKGFHHFESRLAGVVGGDPVAALIDIIYLPFDPLRQDLQIFLVPGAPDGDFVGLQGDHLPAENFSSTT